MADWYVAPDGVVKTGLAFSTIGTSGYGHSWAKAVKWSDLQAASGAWANRADGDIFHLLLANKSYPISNGAGWVGLVNNKVGIKFRGETIDGADGVVEVYGTRDSPWPKAGQTAVYGGETFMTATVAGCAPVFQNMGFVNLKDPCQPNAGSSIDVGLILFDNCYSRNTSRGLTYTESRTDGRSAMTLRHCSLNGYEKGNARGWANNSGAGITMLDCFANSEHQNDNSSTGSASTPSGAHTFDSNPIYQTVKSPTVLERSVFINHRAGYLGSAYPQGDGAICEENVGTITAKDILTYGNGDRGIDLKCAGTLSRFTSFGDAYGIGHHLDTIPVDIYQSVIYAGARLSTATSPPNVACLQASGWVRAFKSWLAARPTAAQVALNAYGVTTASVDPHKWQSQVYGGTHQGRVELIDCYELVKTSTGATEQVGYAGTGVNGRVGAIFGLTPATTYHFDVRALGPDWTAGPYTGSPVTAVMSADGGGERVAPAAPTSFVAVAGADGRDIVCTWVSVAEDAGTSIQGYIVEVDAGDGAGFLPFLPAKSASPLTLSGFLPNHAYVLRMRTFDANMNLSAATATQNVTTANTGTSTATPNAPTNVAADPGWVAHCTAFGIGHTTAATGFTAPSTGTVSVYEVKDNDTGLLVARMGSIRLASQDTPTLAKTNVNLLAV